MNLRLREVEDADLPVFFEQQLDPEANRAAAFTYPDPADRQVFEDHWRRIRSNPETVIRAIEVDGELTGYVAGFRQAGRHEVAYWLVREFWGRGIGSEALSAFLDGWKPGTVYARAAADNIASRRVLEKCGFTVVGQERGFANARGEEIDELVFERSHDSGTS